MFGIICNFNSKRSNVLCLDTKCNFVEWFGKSGDCYSNFYNYLYRNRNNRNVYRNRNEYSYRESITERECEFTDDLFRCFSNIDRSRSDILYLDTECDFVEQFRKPGYGNSNFYHNLYSNRNRQQWLFEYSYVNSHCKSDTGYICKRRNYLCRWKCEPYCYRRREL